MFSSNQNTQWHISLRRAAGPSTSTLDTSKTPQAGDARITAPVLASADLAKIAKQIQAIQATEGGNAKRPAKAAAKPPLVPMVPVQSKPASPPKIVTATAPSKLAAAILAARTAAGLSQSALAAKHKTAQAKIARLEKAGSIPSTSTLQRIAKATGHRLWG
jgi:hypothetical protein